MAGDVRGAAAAGVHRAIQSLAEGNRQIAGGARTVLYCLTFFLVLYRVLHGVVLYRTTCDNARFLHSEKAIGKSLEVNHS